MRRTRPLLDRMADKFTVGDDCWQWTGARTSGGYGRISVGGRNGIDRPAHAVLYELMVGPIPDGLEIDHLCRDASCVRPDHLEAVTHGENMRRSTAAEKAGEARRARTHCPQGHPYDEENTYVSPKGYRGCRECGRQWNRAYYHDRKARKVLL